MSVPPPQGTASMRRTSSAGATSSPKRETARAPSANSTTARSPGRSLSASTAAATAASAIFSPAMLSEVSTISTTWCRRSTRRCTMRSPGSGCGLPSRFSTVASTSSSPPHGSSSGSRTVLVAALSGPTRRPALLQHRARRQLLGAQPGALAGVAERSSAQVAGELPAVQILGRRAQLPRQRAAVLQGAGLRLRPPVRAAAAPPARPPGGRTCGEPARRRSRRRTRRRQTPRPGPPRARRRAPAARRAPPRTRRPRRAARRASPAPPRRRGAAPRRPSRRSARRWRSRRAPTPRGARAGAPASRARAAPPSAPAGRRDTR